MTHRVPRILTAVLIVVGAASSMAQSWTISAPACVTPGGSIDVTITVNSMATQQATAQWRFNWDPAVFQIDSAFGSSGVQLAAGWDGAINTGTAGLAYVGVWHLAPFPTGSAVHATVRLIHIGGFGNSNLTGTVEVWTAPPPTLAPITASPFAMISDNIVIGCVGVPSCNITSPLSGATITGSGVITFNTSDPTSDPLNITYQFNAGGGFMPASRVGGGPSMDLGVPPAAGLTFNWDVNTDFFLPDTGVVFRITVVDASMNGNFCEITVDTDIINQTPVCNITSPMAGATIESTQLFTFNVSDGDMNPVDILYEYDSGLGGGFQPASRVGGGSSMDSGVAPASGLTFNWNIAADIVGAAPLAVFRITVDDLRPMGISNCSVAVNVIPPNIPPSCNIIFPGSGAMLMTSQSILFSTADGNGDPLDIFYEFNPGTGFQPASRVGGGPSMDLAVPPSGALSFMWNIAADFTMSTPNVPFRITVVDPRSAMNSCSRTYNITAVVPPNSPPTCAITSPAPGAVASGTQLITFNAMDADADPLAIIYEFDAGGGFMPASRVGGGASMDLGVAPATGLTFDWDVDADVLAVVPNVVFRVRMDDGRGGLGNCTVQVSVLPAGSCPPVASCGDCNSDTIITILDSLTAAQIAVGLITPGATQFNRCNVSGLLAPAPGSLVDIIDSLTLAQFAAGLPVALVCC